MTKTTGERIKQRRIALGLSQTELARRAGYADKSGISKIESGDRDLTPAKLERFAEALGCTPSDLLSDVWNKPLVDAPLVLTDDEEVMIHKLRELPDRDRDYVLKVLDFVYSAYQRYIEEDSEDAGV